MTATKFKAWFREFPASYAELQPSKPSAETVRYRFMELDHTRATEDQRKVEATLSTEAPVIRAGYREILRHNPEAVNLERATDNTLPLLWSHNQDQQIGVAENVRVFQGKLRATLRFSKSARGEEIWQDVKAGIVRGISIGYLIDDYVEKDAGNDWQSDLVAVRWTPFEASCVSCPADLSAGIGRALESGSVYELPPKVAILHRQHRLHERYRAMLDKFPEIEQAETAQERLADIQTRMMTVTTDDQTTQCLDLIRDLSIDHWCDQETGAPISGIQRTQGTKPMEQQFSLCRALALTFDPATIRTGGPELEIMEETAKRLHKGRGERYTIPENAIFRSLTKGGDGGDLIATSHLASMFIPALRERMITGRMGATILPGLTGDIQIPRQTADSSATWLAGDGSDQVTPSDPTYDKITLSPTSVGVSSTISRKMLLQGDPASEELVKNSLAFAIAKAIDVAAINGSGASNQPTGILSQTGVATTTYANGGSPSFANIVDLEGELMTDDADMGNLGYVTTGALASGLKQTEIVASTGRMVWEATAEGEGRMNGYRALVSNLMPAGYVLFGNWADLIIAMWSGLDFVVDPYTRASYGDVVITVWTDCDIAVRHGESFAEIHEAAS